MLSYKASGIRDPCHGNQADYGPILSRWGFEKPSRNHSASLGPFPSSAALSGSAPQCLREFGAESLRARGCSLYNSGGDEGGTLSPQGSSGYLPHWAVFCSTDFSHLVGNLSESPALTPSSWSGSSQNALGEKCVKHTHTPTHSPCPRAMATLRTDESWE